jgi:hypothetical protein
MSGCGGPAREPLPDHYGVFVTSAAALREMNALSHTRVSQTSQGIGVEEFDSLSATLPGEGLSFVSYGFDEPLLAKAVEPGKSHRYRVDEIAPLEVQPVSGRRDTLRFAPRAPLQRGGYILSVRGCLENGWNKRCYYSFAIE